MFLLLIGVALISAVSSLICPPTPGFYGSTYSGDGSCYTEVEPFYDKNSAYSSCAQANSYLPFVINAFQNAEIQNKTMGGGGHFGEKLVGMWLGLMCTGHMITSCTWDDGTPLNSKAYHNFERGSPNATVGPCVYQDGTTGRWKSEACSLAYTPTNAPGGRVGAFCKYTPTNHVPMCPEWNHKFPEPADRFPEYFDGFCYELYNSNNTMNAENICTQKCGHVVSIHSEGENSFVRDILISASEDSRYNCWPLTSGFLGISGNSTQWSDGTPIGYTNYANPPVADPNSCAFMAVNTSGFCTPPDDRSPLPSGYWYTSTCQQPQPKYVLCKKPLLNNCDKPFEPFPQYAPSVCNGGYFLGTKGTFYAPGSPYYPFGQQPNVCEYIQKLQDGQHPSMTVYYETPSNFLPNVSISKFEFYSSEDPNDTPFYRFDGYPYLLPPVVSPTNILRAVYTTIGDPNHVYDWRSMDYSTAH